HRLHARQRVREAIRSRPVPKHDNVGLKYSCRPGDDEELGIAVLDCDHYRYAFAHFLDEFYLFRRPTFFAKEPEFVEDLRPRIARRRERGTPEFRRRNILFA